MKTEAEILRMLSTSNGLLTSLDQQRVFITKLEREPRACPHCDTPFSVVEAMGGLEKFWESLTSTHEKVTACPHCKGPVAKAVPLFGQVAYFWEKTGPTPMEAVRIAEARAAAKSE